MLWTCFGQLKNQRRMPERIDWNDFYRLVQSGQKKLFLFYKFDPVVSPSMDCKKSAIPLDCPNSRSYFFWCEKTCEMRLSSFVFPFSHVCAHQKNKIVDYRVRFFSCTCAHQKNRTVITKKGNFLFFLRFVKEVCCPSRLSEVSEFLFLVRKNAQKVFSDLGSLFGATRK